MDDIHMYIIVYVYKLINCYYYMYTEVNIYTIKKLYLCNSGKSIVTIWDSFRQRRYTE